ncbi:MAG: flagellar basal body rod protein FlgC, partial [Pseudorhodoplanes sp.]|nr:flagellar basal body rod protein FlgC [Pseudorhodoplanes sp.]
APPAPAPPPPGRMRIIAENLANSDSTAQSAGADPYRRKIPTFRSEMDRALDANVVKLGPVRTDTSDFPVKHQPGHPAADANGNVKYPNVNALLEMTDMREAQRSYDANINVIGATRRMLQRTIDILKV